LRAGAPILTAVSCPSAHTMSTIVVCQLVPASRTRYASRLPRPADGRHPILFGRLGAPSSSVAWLPDDAQPSGHELLHAARTMNVATMQAPCRSGPTQAWVVFRRGGPPGDKSDRVRPGRSCHNDGCIRAQEITGNSRRDQPNTSPRIRACRRLPYGQARPHPVPPQPGPRPHPGAREARRPP